MMIERVRLQRKFNMKSDVDVGQRVAQIVRMMILFELSIILVVCLLNLSLHFHLNHVFAAQFWTTEEIINSNLALAICSFLLVPYLIFIEHTTIALVKDLVATALIIHALLCFIYSLSFNLGYLAYISVLTIFMVIIGGYVAIFREQKKLIDEVRSIEASDRIQPRLKEEESEHLSLGCDGH